MQKKTRQRFSEVLKKLLMFMLTSFVGTLVDLGVHWYLSANWYTDSYIWTYWVAPFISFELAVLTNFLTAYYFVWRERITYHGTRSFWRHYAAYNATCTGTFFIKILLMQGIHTCSSPWAGCRTSPSSRCCATSSRCWSPAASTST